MQYITWLLCLASLGLLLLVLAVVTGSVAMLRAARAIWTQPARRIAYPAYWGIQQVSYARHPAS